MAMAFEKGLVYNVTRTAGTANGFFQAWFLSSPHVYLHPTTTGVGEH